ncbi:hypothetical protein ACI6Q2_01630 [Chitinophagaceae bacterium LWZ2-11]
MQNKKRTSAKKTLVATSIIAGSLLSIAALANSNFSFRALGSANDVRNALSTEVIPIHLEGACGAAKAKDGKCGAKKDSTMSKSKDGKCGEGKCGGTKKKDAKKDTSKKDGKGN